MQSWFFPYFSLLVIGLQQNHRTKILELGLFFQYSIVRTSSSDISPLQLQPLILRVSASSSRYFDSVLSFACVYMPETCTVVPENVYWKIKNVIVENMLFPYHDFKIYRCDCQPKLFTGLNCNCTSNCWGLTWRWFSSRCAVDLKSWRCFWFLTAVMLQTSLPELAHIQNMFVASWKF